MTNRKKQRKNQPTIIIVTIIATLFFAIFTYTSLAIKPFEHQYGTYSLLSDYQYDDNGGNGNLRIMTFYPSINTVQVQTYSPYTGRYETDDDSLFTIPLEMGNKETAAFTVIVLPDTQYYTVYHPDIFLNQTRWIVANKQALNIIHVIHLGDLVEHYESASEWQTAKQSMDILTDNGISYSTVAGNHDGDVFSGNFANYNTFFGNENSYTQLTSSGVKLLLVNLRCYPTQRDIDWANQVIADNPNRIVILSTHSYIADNTGALNGEGNNIYNQIVSPNNIPLVLCGHNRREALRYDQFKG